jgi:SAM-dependent methyltransferase
MNFEEYVRFGKSQEFHAALSPEEWRIYHQGQADHAAQIIDEVIERIPLPRHAVDLLDLGGGHGLYSIAFCRRYRHLHARVLDLATTNGELERKEVSDSAGSRVQFEVGDIRTISLQPNSNDVILLANVVHHFDEPTNRSLLQRLAMALRPGGLVIVIDAVRPSSLEQTGQLEGLLDLYFGAANGVGCLQRPSGVCPLAGFKWRAKKNKSHEDQQERDLGGKMGILICKGLTLVRFLLILLVTFVRGIKQ